MSQARGRAVCVLIVALLISLAGHACAVKANDADATVRGTYHIDRWGERHVGRDLTSPALDKVLGPFLEAAVALEAAEVDRGDGFSQPTITRVKKVQKAWTSKIRCTISWLDPAATPTQEEEQQFRKWIEQLGSGRF